MIITRSMRYWVAIMQSAEAMGGWRLVGRLRDTTEFQAWVKSDDGKALLMACESKEYKQLHREMLAVYLPERH